MGSLSEANVRDFGAMGDGAADDSTAIQKALDTTTGGLFFPAGTYRLTQGLTVDLAARGHTHLRSAGAQLINESNAPALHILGSHFGTADPPTMTQQVAASQLMPTVSGLEIVGANPEADGIRLEGTYMGIITGVTIRNCQHGIHIPNHNRNLIISDCHIYNCRGVGIFLDEVNLHQINIHGSHISYNKAGGIKVLRGNVRNLQIVGNDIEYNRDPDSDEPVADVWIIAGPVGIREGAIVGNTIQATRTPGGANVRIEGLSPEQQQAAQEEDPSVAGFGRSPGQQAGLFSIAGNLITNQEYNILISDASGISIGDNQHIGGYKRNIMLQRCQQIAVTGAIIDYIHDYEGYGDPLCGGIELDQCTACTLTGCILNGCGKDAGLTLDNCRGINVTGCTFRSPQGHGVQMDSVTHSRVGDCIFLDDGGQMTAAVTGQNCTGNIVEGNLIA